MTPKDNMRIFGITPLFKLQNNIPFFTVLLFSVISRPQRPYGQLGTATSIFTKLRSSDDVYLLFKCCFVASKGGLPRKFASCFVIINIVLCNLCNHKRVLVWWRNSTIKRHRVFSPISGLGLESCPWLESADYWTFPLRSSGPSQCGHVAGSKPTAADPLLAHPASPDNQNAV